MKNLSKLRGAKTLNKNEQKSINGGKACTGNDACCGCPAGYSCVNGECKECV